MMTHIWEIALQTPWWVYALFVYLMYVGVKASRPSELPLKVLFIIPIIFTYMSVHTLLVSFKVDGSSVSIWATSILVGTFLGYLQIFRVKLTVDREKGLIRVPGTWSTLIIIFIIFATKYYFGYELAVDPALASNTIFEFTALGVSGLCTGMFIGRLICYLHRYYQ